MQSLRSEIEIVATRDKVWRVLTDFSAYPAWNPFIRSISGELASGAQLHVTVQPAGGNAMSFNPRVLLSESGRELRWKGQLFVPGLFDGEHYFQLNEISAGTTVFTHGEVFTGLLVPLVMRGSMLGGTKRGFEEMNEALKARAEALPSGAR